MDYGAMARQGQGPEPILNDAELRRKIFAQAFGKCEWPYCLLPAAELAHIVSKGMGGSRYRNTISNAFAACTGHARISDGLPPPGGNLTDRNREYLKVPGTFETYLEDHQWRTRDVMDALTKYLHVHRSLTTPGGSVTI